MEDKLEEGRAWTAIPNPSLVWLAIGAIVGGTFAILVPPFSPPDEYAHLLRAYSCSRGHVYAQRFENLEIGGDLIIGDEMPASLEEIYRDFIPDEKYYYVFNKEQIRLAATRPLDPLRHQQCHHANTALFSPVPYVPATMTFLISRHCQATTLRMFYLGRAAMLASFLALVSLAIWIMPIQKWTMVLVAMMPLPLYLASVLSADTITNGLAFLGTALCLRCAVRVESVARKDLIGLCLTFCLLALCKQFYVILVLLFFMIPKEKFGGTRPYVWALLGIVVLPVVLNLAWMFSVQSIYVPIAAGIDPSAQLRYIFTHPWQFTVTLFNAITGREIYPDMVGVLGRHNVPLVPDCLYHIYWLALIVSAFFDSHEPWRVNWRIRGVALAVCLLTILGISTAIYLSATAVGAPVLVGLQSRYFLPAFLLFFLSLRGPAGKWPRTRPIAMLVVLAAVSFASVASVYTLLQRYYW